MLFVWLNAVMKQNLASAKSFSTCSGKILSPVAVCMTLCNDARIHWQHKCPAFLFKLSFSVTCAFIGCNWSVAVLLPLLGFYTNCSAWKREAAGWPNWGLPVPEEIVTRKFALKEWHNLVFLNTSQFRQNQNPFHFIKSQWKLYKILLQKSLKQVFPITKVNLLSFLISNAQKLPAMHAPPFASKGSNMLLDKPWGFSGVEWVDFMVVKSNFTSHHLTHKEKKTQDAMRKKIQWRIKNP